MKKILLFSLTVMLAANVSAQGQIGNADMENWEAVSTGDEPVNWNSFMTASGGFSGFADVQIEESTDVRPGTAGTSSARIWSRDFGFGVIAIGNMTVGQINMGALTANDPANYNISLTADANFSESFTGTPDSIVFWVKYNAANNSSEARIKATLHDTYDYKDPEDAASSTHVVGSAVLNYLPTSGWVRKSVAFDYTGPGSVNTFILLTFTSNALAGGGDADDEIFIDDVELIYNCSPTIGTDTQVACDSYIWPLNSTTYTNSINTPTVTLTNATGCDSVVTLNLTINRVSDNTIALNGITIQANNSSASYVWLNCDDGFAIISGESNQTYTPAANGNYAVEITENGCVDTSACVAITTVGIIENDFGEGFRVFPNPTDGDFSIDLGGIYAKAYVLISDINGRLIRSNTFGQEQVLNVPLKEPNGVYLISILAGDKRAVIRLIKK